VPDAVGYRLKVGVLIPSTNTVVKAEYNRMAPHGVSIHAGRMWVSNPAVHTDELSLRLLREMEARMRETLDVLLTCEPDHIVMGMSAIAFAGGAAGNDRIARLLAAWSGRSVTTGPMACVQALEVYGAKRIGVISPYQPQGEENVVRFFADMGKEVVRLRSLRPPTATAIARIGSGEIIQALREIDGPDLDAIVQAGTNLAMARVADAAEDWLGKPVIAVNTASLWHALRTHGIEDRVVGFGSPLREH